MWSSQTTRIWQSPSSARVALLRSRDGVMTMFRRLLFTPGAIHLGLCLAAALLVARPCLAQDEQEADADIPEVIDEIVVYGEMSLIQLRREWVRAEENLFEVFNELNSDDESERERRCDGKGFFCD